jgi:hypothetical protein
MNAVEIEEAVSALAEKPFDPAGFPFAFLEAFGNKETTIKRLRSGASNASDIDGSVLQRNNIHIAVCEPGAVGATLKALRESPKTISAKAKFIFATDGVTVEAEDLGSGEVIVSEFRDIAEHFGFFLPLAGISTVKEIKTNPIDVKATGRLNKLYVELLKDNPEWSAADRRHDMNHFMARLIFCFFAEDTGIFQPTKIFTKTVTQMSDSQAGNTHEVVSTLFRAMNVKGSDRASANTPRWADVFPYVNGGLFSGSADVPSFSRIARSYLLRVGDLNWREINPDIFGSMIQAVADDEERGALGLHYTSVPNILKVLNPLFLDDLRLQLVAAGNNPRMLLNLRKRMSKIRLFDPACGSGNFLVIAYKEMRAIEAEINQRRGEPNLRTEIPLKNFRGIELRDFPAEIARLALIIAEFQCDVLYLGQGEALSEFLPLEAMNWIVCDNALRVDWLSLCPPEGTAVKFAADDLFHTPLQQSQIDFQNEGGETYICGNPPYQGSINQTNLQKEDMARVFGPYLKTYKDLDYVASWLVKAAEYSQYTNTSSGFVTTNSLCQGEQVGMLWPILFGMKQRIFFAHTSFKWSNNAAKNAGVTCIVIGIRAMPGGRALLFDGEISRSTSSIGPYLIPSSDTIVSKLDDQLSGLPEMVSGNKATDGGSLIFTREEADQITEQFPAMKKFFRRLEGAKEFIQGDSRWWLWLNDEDLPLIANVRPITDRIEKVRASREASRGKQANDAAAFSHRFVYAPHRPGIAILVPFVSSERRQYLPCGLFDERTIIVAPNQAIYDAPPWCLAILSSRLHLVWIATVCGKLETRYRYSNTLGWNTFPVPNLTDQNKTELRRCAENILLAREAHFPATIADLYDPEAMPEDVRRAHEENDDVLERIYIGRRFKNDTERLEKLFELYTRMTVTRPPATKKARKAA